LDLRANTSVMTETRSCTPAVAPRAWAGERAPGHLPLLHSRTQRKVKVSNSAKAVLRKAFHPSRVARSAMDH
ncbi:MAG: hypothetical protein WA210_04215, partial [Burkholderiaceae bacterium]